MIQTKSKNGQSGIIKKIGSIPVLLFSAIVVAIIAASLWISVTSVLEKIRVSDGLQQIISIVAMAREASRADVNFAVAERRDLLAALERMGRVRTDGTNDGLKFLRNPWNNILVGAVGDNNTIRVESIVPPHICQRFIGSFASNPQSFGIRQVEVRGYNTSWRRVYDQGMGTGIAENNIAAGCSDTVQADVAMIFTLR